MTGANTGPSIQLDGHPPKAILFCWRDPDRLEILAAGPFALCHRRYVELVHAAREAGQLVKAAGLAGLPTLPWGVALWEGGQTRALPMPPGVVFADLAKSAANNNQSKP